MTPARKNHTPYAFYALFGTIVNYDEVHLSDVETFLADAGRYQDVVLAARKIVNDLRGMQMVNSGQSGDCSLTLFCSTCVRPLSSSSLLDRPTNLCARIRGCCSFKTS